MLLAGMNIDKWTIKQWNSFQTYTFGDITIPDNGYLILGRDATKSEFEAHWGTLGSNVIYVNSYNCCPIINGGETYALYDSLDTRIDTTYLIMSSGKCYQRGETNTNNWTELSADSANPGSGALGGYSVGVVITETSDAPGSGNFIYEFIELYYDVGGGNTPPEIHNVEQHPFNPPSNRKAIIRANITDDYGIASDTLYWNLNGGGFYKKSSDSINTTYFYYSIDQEVEEDTITYFITAWDDSNEVAVSDTYSYTITDSNHFNVLFDFTKEETAGEADWIIDDDMPEPYPLTPWDQEDWLGAISDWGYGLAREGHFSVKTLPPDSSITYGEATPLDLSNFDIFIVCEPQNPFTLSEKTAIFDFVRDGGGLFMVGDHYLSDRNSNGWDSPRIWNDLGASDSFGIHFNVSGDPNNNFSDNSYNYSATDSVISGNFGIPDDYYGYWGGTAMTLYPDKNSYVMGHIWKTGSSQGNHDVMLATARFGDGRVAGTGDSSPIDDGTGNPGNTLYDGWGDGSDSIIILNTTYWLCAVSSSGILEDNIEEEEERIIVSSMDNNLILTYSSNNARPGQLSIYDGLGRLIKNERNNVSIRMSGKYQGIYFLIVIDTNGIHRYKLNLFGGGRCLLSK